MLLLVLQATAPSSSSLAPSPTMPSTLPSLFFLLFLLHQTRASDRCPTVLTPPTPTTRIVGGEEASPISVTFVASLIQAFASTCTASLLSSTWLLTARHCLPTDATFVFLGTRHRAEGTLIPIKQVHLHPGDDEQDDIALIQLENPAPQNSTFVRVNTDTSKPSTGAFVKSIGYGSTSYAGPVNRLLREVDTPAVSTATCQTEYLQDTTLDKRALCAGYEAGRCGICSGDSGGPLIQFDPDGNPVQVGVASRSKGCAWAGVPAIFTRVSEFVDWMEDVGAEFEKSESAQQVLRITGDGDDDDNFPVGQQGAQSSRPENDEGPPGWLIAVLTGGPVLAFVVVAVIVFTFARMSNSRRDNDSRAETMEDPAGEEAEQSAVRDDLDCENMTQNTSPRDPGTAVEIGDGV